MDCKSAERVQLLGIPVDIITLEAALQWVLDASHDRKPRQIMVVNANKLYLISRHAQLATVARKADLSIPEWSVVWAAKRLKLPPLNHVGGVMLAKEFLPFAASNGLRPYFLGASRSVVESLAASLAERYPRLSIAGFHHGYFSAAEEADVLSDIQRSRPDMLFVALGSPRQELWIDRHKERLQVPVSIGVGGSFDVIAGIKRDAPGWVRGSGFEWLYRMLQEPSVYVRRYAVTNTWFLWQISKERSKRRQP